MASPLRVSFLRLGLCAGLAAGAAAARAEGSAADRMAELKRLALEDLMNIEVRSAALRPKPLRRAPATTYILTAEEIAASGARTLPDALRLIPGVDVTAFRTGQGEASIRGLNTPLNNRTLVLLDGRTILNPLFDFAIWEKLPVGLDEVARIEVVEGPTSAVYGANAVSGVVNIITKTPAELAGTRLAYSLGQRNLNEASLLRSELGPGRTSKLSAGYRTANRFDDGRLRAAETGRTHAQLDWELPSDSRLSLSGGITRHKINVAPKTSPVEHDGVTGFLAANAEVRDVRIRGFWNAERTVTRDLPSLRDPSINQDTYDLTLNRPWSLPGSHELTAGLGLRRNRARSGIFGGGSADQYLYNLTLEDEWRPLEALTLTAGLRGDHHPLTRWNFSPRGSVILDAGPNHSVRFSGGTAFRNPTLVENHVDATLPLIGGQTHTLGNLALASERMTSFELAHLGRFGPLRTRLTGFHYRLTEMIRPSPAKIISLAPLLIETSQQNSGETKALGYELALDWAVRPGLAAFTNYSYQSLSDQLPDQRTAGSAPKHKVNTGSRLTRGPMDLGLWLHWQAKTLWPRSTTESGLVAAYALLNAHAGYRFGPRFPGLELSLDAFNLGGHLHYEARPAENASRLGQGAEAMGRTLSASVSYQY